MPKWNDLLSQFEQKPEAERGPWILDEQKRYLKRLSEKRGGRNVVFYASAFLQKSGVGPAALPIAHEDLNGLMSVMRGLDFNAGLTLLLHTPGGVTNATETLVEYLRSKFSFIEVIIPTFAMSAGTMISLELQDVVLTSYHIATLAFEKGPATKIIVSHLGRMWVKNLAVPAAPIVPPPRAG